MNKIIITIFPTKKGSALKLLISRSLSILLTFCDQISIICTPIDLHGPIAEWDIRIKPSTMSKKYTAYSAIICPDMQNVKKYIRRIYDKQTVNQRYPFNEKFQTWDRQLMRCI